MAREALSRGDLLLLASVLAAAGVGVSALLTWQWFTGGGSSACDLTNFFSCTAVRESPYASFAGIPTASVGLAGFVILLALSMAGFRGVESLGPWSVDAWLLLFAVLGALAGLFAAAGTELVAYLLYTRVFDLEYAMKWNLWWLLPLLGAVLVGAAGYWGTRRVVRRSPLVVLRGL